MLRLTIPSLDVIPIMLFEMVVSMAHLEAKFLTSNEVGVCKGNQQIARELYLQALKCNRVCVIDIEPKETLEGRGKPTEEIEEV